MKKLSGVLLLLVRVPELPGHGVASAATLPGPRFPGKIVPAGFFREDWFM